MVDERKHHQSLFIKVIICKLPPSLVYVYTWGKSTVCTCDQMK